MDWTHVAAVVFGVLGTVGGGVAAAWAWYVKQRDKERAKKQRHQDREDERTGKPYKQLFGELKEQLDKATEGFQKLQDEHATCRESLARLEERVTHLEGRRTP